MNVSSYDVSTNPTVRRVRRSRPCRKKKTCSGGMKVMVKPKDCVTNRWSSRVNPTVFHQELQVNFEAVDEDVGGGIWDRVV